jgi:hypothetical protein
MLCFSPINITVEYRNFRLILLERPSGKHKKKQPGKRRSNDNTKRTSEFGKRLTSTVTLISL